MCAQPSTSTSPNPKPRARAAALAKPLHARVYPSTNRLAVGFLLELCFFYFLYIVGVCERDPLQDKRGLGCLAAFSGVFTVLWHLHWRAFFIEHSGVYREFHEPGESGVGWSASLRKNPIVYFREEVGAQFALMAWCSPYACPTLRLSSSSLILPSTLLRSRITTMNRHPSILQTTH